MGQVSGLIIAMAFLILVIFVGIFLMKMIQTVTKINDNVKSLTRDVDDVSKQSSRLLSTSNELLHEVDRKLITVDPVFKAMAKVGASVAKVNDTVDGLAKKMHRHHKIKKSWFYRIGKLAFDCFRLKKSN